MGPRDHGEGGPGEWRALWVRPWAHGAHGIPGIRWSNGTVKLRAHNVPHAEHANFCMARQCSLSIVWEKTVHLYTITLRG